MSAEALAPQAAAFGPVRPYPSDADVATLFLRQAAATPAAPAVTSGATTLTYAELAQRSASLAGALAAHGAGPGDLVAVRLGRGVDWVVANLAVLRTGAAYLPIDPAEPTARVAQLLADSGAVLVVDGSPLAGSAPLPPSIPATGPAYVMYTSGSTGRPKGVLVSHRNIARLVCGTDFADLTAPRILQTGAVSFDATTFELWGALLNGGTVVLPAGDLLDADRLGAQLRAHAITTMWLTSALFSRLATADPSLFAPLRDLLVGGDVVAGEHVAAVLRACPGLRVSNGYGPTENTTFSTTHPISPADTAGPLPIGRPLANSSAYVLDDERRPVADGEPGELYVGGDGVALGYLGRPDLTAAAFLDDPFRPGGRMYRTGDFARRRPDGVLEFLGRRDEQVKVRGFRIEPGEVEAALRAEEGVTGAVVVARDRETPGEKYLVAYVTGDGFLDPAALRTALAARLPAHLVPGHVLELDALPLTPHGKVDRAALPDPADFAGLPAEFVPPRDAAEQRLAEIWRDVLGVPAVGVLDSLFDLGVDSLTAATLAARARAAFGCALSTGDLLGNPTIEAVARLTGGPAPAVAARATGSRHPLTPQQRPLYAAQQRDPGTVRYNVPVVLETAGVDHGRMQDALRALVARHDALRTAFVLADEPLQVVADHVDVVLERRTGAPVPDRLIRPFDLTAAPLLRAWLHDDRVLVLDFHHLVVDGTSLGQVVRELDALYRGESLPAPAHQYADIAVPPPDTAYWRAVHAEPLPDFVLPAYGDPAVRTYAGATLDVHFGAERTAALRACAARCSTTLFAPLFAAYSVFLTTVTGARDHVVAVPAAGAGGEGTVGMFAQTLGLRTRPGGSFDAFTAEVARLVREASARGPAPDGPVPATMFALQGAGLLDVEFLGRRAALRPLFPGQTMFDLNLQVYEDDGDLRGEWEYATERFEPGTAAALRTRLLETVDRLLAAPGAAVLPSAPPPAAAPPAPEFDL
ncbi:non-ribosomal peptide synthetase [Amycolatopsis sp. CA-126428]|uniref:non-ribosomal peptide synthetase n=1 Tax=Amycolatopsis sp. CA-126428 TaxID=2073158 RepID=UPI000CD21C6C|nr:non-ribosomal peptide synthetase [Amycolatopsis sp. CA-126428]